MLVSLVCRLPTVLNIPGMTIRRVAVCRRGKQCVVSIVPWFTRRKEESGNVLLMILNEKLEGTAKVRDKVIRLNVGRGGEFLKDKCSC